MIVLLGLLQSLRTVPQEYGHSLGLHSFLNVNKSLVSLNGCSWLLNHHHFLNEKANWGRHISTSYGETALYKSTRYVLCFGKATYRPMKLYFKFKTKMTRLLKLSTHFLNPKKKKKKVCQGSLSLKPFGPSNLHVKWSYKTLLNTL